MVPGPSGESFYGALAMSVPPADEPADFLSMTYLTMPRPHADFGMARAFSNVHASNVHALQLCGGRS
jgi:hypothetical protein